MKIKSTVSVALFLGLMFFPIFSALATSVDRMSFTNQEGRPGETIELEMILEGTDAGERVGYWYTNYKETEGDTAEMDITSWISIEPKDYTIKQGESISFKINVCYPGSGFQ